MTTNRIQKLLFSEYSDFEDVVLVESPFAETTRQGEGIRQVQIGLTPTKLILASYFVEALDEFSEVDHPRRGKDPDIESFELVSAYPVECINLSVYRHKSRQTLKARFCNGKVVYYEIGGWQERKMLWSVWCERIKFLSPYETGTSVSETSVGSSSSASSLYIVRSSLSVSQTGQPTLWCHYASSQATYQGSWGDPHLYLGPAYIEKGVNFMSLPEIGKNPSCCAEKKKTPSPNFPEDKLMLSLEHEKIAKESVELWESQRRSPKIRRRYAFYPWPGLLDGIGLWHLSKPQAFSLQRKRSVSLAHLAASSDDLSNQLDFPATQLVRRISLENLTVPAMSPDKLFQLADNKPPPRDLEFWTDDQRFKLDWQHTQYLEQQRHIRDLRKDVHSRLSCSKQKSENAKKSHFTMCQSARSRVEAGTTGGGDSCDISNRNCTETQAVPQNGPWTNFSSTSLAHQLTMIDKDLFLQLNTLELGRVRKDWNCCRAPHLRALVTFSYRITCLVATHIISASTVKERALQIVRYIGVAYKCHKLHSLQSAASVLHGLQCPAVYRLYHSWRYVRKHHASKYRRFEDLSKRYLDPRLPLYQKTYDNTTRIPPYLPDQSLLIAILLRRLTQLPNLKSSKFTTDTCVLPASDPVPKTVRRFLSAFNMNRPTAIESQDALTITSSCRSESHLHTLSTETLMDNLDKFFAPVSATCPARRHLQDVEYFLETNQAATSRYAIPVNTKVRDFLLLARYDNLQRLFSWSKQLEP